MAKDAETSKPKHINPTSEYYLSSQANSELSSRGSPAMSQNAIGTSSGPLQASAAATQNNNPSLSQAQAAATSAIPGPAYEQMQRLTTFLESSPSGTDSLVGLSDGLQTNAIKAGSVSLAGSITLRHVLYVPNLAVNLISVSCLATHANCFVAFSHDICVLQDCTLKSPIGLGKMHRGVFVFQPLSTGTVAAVSESESYELWHRRMGHPSSQPLIHLPTISVVSPSLKTICDVCCRAKHSRIVFPDSTSRAMDIFGLIHCDIWGPYRKGWWVYDLETNQVFFSRDVKFEETVFPFTTPLGPSPTPATTTFCPAWDCAEHPMASPPVIGGDTPPVTGGDPPPLPAATPSLGLSGITVGPDPEISSSASPPSSPTAPSPILGRGKRQKKAPSVLKDYVCHTVQVLSPASSTPTNGSSGPSNWFAKLSTALRSYGFLQSHADHTLFTYRKGDVFLSVPVYVDDLILAGNNSTACFSFKKYLNDCFKLKDLGPLKYFLGIKATRGPRGLFLSQCKYALDILYKSGLSASKPAAFPMEQNHDCAFLSDPGPYR
ncbi:hypothetical protein RJ639_031369 [Escallonia herrerae]|uniref:Reverse transcriptase Ty1/copia-type domain-containing protein n=1 Tax=Escallonia herrerae TaxID=1293975 RepID=A0AA88WX72_9ASTE|nr:hypothetical protein RJ639_031369 [Escallonia herrerae]